MTGTGAFHADPALKAALLATIERHAAAGTLIFGGAAWDGLRGTPMGVAIEGDDPAEFAARYGFPLPLAALLDTIMGGIPGYDAALAATRAWLSAVPVGADLSRVPSRLLIGMLKAEDVTGAEDRLRDEVIALHQRDVDGVTPCRADWSTLRARIEQCDPSSSPICCDIVKLLDACCWPAARGRSTMSLAVHAWSHARVHRATGTWTQEDETRTQATLARLWDEHEAAGKRHADIDFPSLFAAVDPVLSARYDEYLGRSNACFLESFAIVARMSQAMIEDSAIIGPNSGAPS